MQCGLVVDEYRVDHGPEWRSFSDDGVNRERTGAPLTRSRHDRGLSTEIGRATRATGRKRRQFARLRRQHNRARIATKRERNQVYAFTEVRRLASELELPRHVVEQACTLFRSAQKEDLLRGRSLEGFAAATVYAVCRIDGVSRTVEEIVAAARADDRELRVAYDALNRDLGLPTGPIDPAEYVARFASRLDVPRDVERAARDLIAQARERNLCSGRKPSGVAAACLYTAARAENYPLTQGAAADAADVSPATLRKTYRALDG